MTFSKTTARNLSASMVALSLAIAACGDASIEPTTPSENTALSGETSAPSATDQAGSTPPPTTTIGSTAAPSTTELLATEETTAPTITDVPAIIEPARRIDEMYGVYGPQSDDGVSPDGSGCSPGAEALPDGIWYVALVSINPDEAELDLICRFSGAAAFAHADYLGGDYVYVNQSSRLRVGAVAPDAVIWLLADAGVPDSQLAMNSIEASRAIDGLGFAPFVWTLIEDGLIVELWES